MRTKHNTYNRIPTTVFSAILLVTALTVAPGAARAEQNGGNHYRQVNLVSDLPGTAMLLDTNLVNAWGISFGPTSPFWVSANGTGLSMIYSVTYTNGMVHVAKVPLEVGIPGEGNVTGQVFNGTGDFNQDIFIFASEDGTISGWRPPLGTSAEVLATGTNAVYKGITLAMTAVGPALLAANFSDGTVDVYDTNRTLVAQLRDQNAPSDYSPLNVQVIAGHVFVTFAKHSPGGEDDVAGPGNGIIDVLDTRTGTFHRLATGTDAGGDLKEINSPWGLTLAPQSFGKHAGELLVGNFGSGTIMTFDLRTGKFRGLLKAERGGALVIDGLWGLTTGNGQRAGRSETVYFSAGPDGEAHGLFGSLDPAKDGGHDKGD